MGIEGPRGIDLVEGVVVSHAALAGLIALCGELKGAGVLGGRALDAIFKTMSMDIERAPASEATQGRALGQIERAWNRTMS